MESCILDVFRTTPQAPRNNRHETERGFPVKKQARAKSAPSPADVERFDPAPGSGLSAAQVEQRKREGLCNTQPKPITKTVWQILRDNIFTLFNAFNFAVAACLLLVGAYENILFLGIVIANSFISIIQELRSKHMVEKLSVISLPRTTVVRGGAEKEVAVEEMVLDDVTVLTAGRQICADSIVLDGEIEANEALLTGESEPIAKRAGDALLSGSFVVSGRCRARVEHVGADNYASRLAADAKTYKKHRSILLDSLNKIVKFTSIFVLPVGALLFLHAHFILDSGIADSVSSTAAAILGMMPKGLVLLTTASLVLGVIRLARKQTLVQELFCIETLSRVDVLCLDKTGTLTQGRMTVNKIVPLDESVLPAPLSPCLGSFIQALDDNNATFQALAAHFTEPEEGLSPQCKTPFSSARKWSSVTFEGKGTVIVGAPDVLLRGRGFPPPP